MTSFRPMAVIIASLCVAIFGGCSDDAGTGTSGTNASDGASGQGDSADATGDVASSSDGTSTAGDLPSHFKAAGLISASKVDCTLDNGDKTTCHQLVFKANPVETGPFCPKTVNDIGGLGIYDGKTNPGFQVMKKALWDAMEADGYDVVDDSGNVRIQDPGDMSQKPESGKGYCLEAAFDDGLEVTFWFPVTPVDLATPNQIETVELIGASLDGVPINGDPPSVVSGMGPGGAIPALDPCGGHADPAGYYHWHFVAESMNSVLDAYKITDVSCTKIAQAPSALVGFAKDGYPIYGALDADGNLPTGLDACNGKVGPTKEYPGGIYHYYAAKELAPNVPGCLKGASVSKAFSVSSK